MCIALLAIDVHPRYPLIVIANRDEEYQRPTERMHIWETVPPILAGRDKLSGGSWFAIDEAGTLALVTNVRDGQARSVGGPSRGALVLEALGDSSRFRDALPARAMEYAGFNLIFGRGTELSHYSNRDSAPIKTLTAGVHGLSNATLNTPWPKVERGKRRLSEVVAREETPVEHLFEILADGAVADDDTLPKTGVPLEVERALSPIFISTNRGYGSRSATVLIQERDGTTRLWERNYLSNDTRRFQLVENSFFRLF